MLMEEKTQLWFKFDPSNRFIKDFYKVWDSEVFFLAIEDSLYKSISTILIRTTLKSLLRKLE